MDAPIYHARWFRRWICEILLFLIQAGRSESSQVLSGHDNVSRNLDEITHVANDVSDIGKVIRGLHMTRDEDTELTSSPEFAATVIANLHASGALVQPLAFVDELIAAQALITVSDNLILIPPNR